MCSSDLTTTSRHHNHNHNQITVRFQMMKNLVFIILFHKSVAHSFFAPISMSLILSSRDKLNNGVKLILASQSPRRREILDMMGLAGRYTVQPSPLDETALQLSLTQSLTNTIPTTSTITTNSSSSSRSSRSKNMTPQDYTLTLAQEKSKALAIQLATDCTTTSTLVLGSDTIVDLEIGRASCRERVLMPV